MHSRSQEGLGGDKHGPSRNQMMQQNFGAYAVEAEMETTERQSLAWKKVGSDEGAEPWKIQERIWLRGGLSISLKRERSKRLVSLKEPFPKPREIQLKLNKGLSW